MASQRISRGKLVMQCSAVQCSAMQCSAVQCSAMQCSAVPSVQGSAVQIIDNFFVVDTITNACLDPKHFMGYLCQILYN